MDKNMISIDELVKQRLSGREEKERPGGWLSMKNLLDKEMPVAAATSTGNLRRTMGYAAALLLLAGISFGSYEIASKFRDNRTATNNNLPAGQGTGTDMTANGANTILPSATNKSVADESTKEATANNQPATQANKNTAGKINTDLTIAHKSSASSGSTTLNANSNHKNPKVPKGLPTAVVSANQSTQATINKPNSKSENIDNNYLNINKKELNIASNTSGGANKQATNNSNNNTVEKPAPALAPNSNAPTVGKDKLPRTGNDEPKKPYLAENKMADNNKAADEMGGPKKARLEMDSINKIETKQVYTGKGRYKTDTISKGKVALARYSVIEDVNELMALNKKIAADNLVVPNATVPNASSEEHMVSLSDHKVSSRKGSGMYPSRFEEMVKNAKMSMNGVSFYPGILAGVSCSAVNGRPAFGFQLGATGLVKMSESWSVLTELKYMNNITNRTTIDDGYNRNLTDYTDPANTAIITYRWDSVAHNFGYSSLSSLHMPIALRYSIGRVNVFGGLNMAYNFGVNIYDGGATYHKSETRVREQGGFDWHAAPAKYDAAKDFNAKFGLGYLFGASYQVSPAMQIDMRVATQSIWNNAKTTGGKEVFNHLYRSPSFQLNASYRFSNSKYRRKH